MKILKWPPIKLFKYFSKLTLRKKIFAIILLLIFTGFIIFQTTSSLTTPQYTIEKPKKTTLLEIVTESGNIKAIGRIDIFSPTNGVVSEVFVQNDQNIIKGEKLFSVISSASDQEKQAANAAYLTAIANYNAAQAFSNTLRSDMYTKWKIFVDMATSSTYETGDGKPKDQERLAAEFQSSQDDWKAAEKKYKDQETAIAATAAQVSASRLAYESTQNTTVTSPITGTIKNLSISKNDSVNIFLATNPSPPVLSITNSNNINIVVPIGQTDIAKIEIGQDAIILPDAYKESSYKAKIIRKDDLGSNSKGIATYNVYLEITNPDFRLKPGMTIDAEITTKKLDQVLTVPNSALVPYQGGKAVRMLEANKQIKFLPVKIGSKGENRTQILEGLKENQEIITSVNKKSQGRGLLGL